MSTLRIAKKYTGLKFGKWTVLERDLTQKRPMKYFCLCECGNKKSQNIQNITRGLSTQCQECAELRKSKDMIGKRYSHMVVISIEKFEGEARAKVICDCGGERYLLPSLIKRGVYKSCGQCIIFRKNPPKMYLKLGSKKGLLTIIREIDKVQSEAICECGTKKIVKKHHMQNMMPSCGCYWKNLNIENAKRLIGTKSGYLKVVKFLGMRGKKKRANYLLKCKCGNFIEKVVGHIFSVKSCGCYQKERVPKGSRNHMAKTTESEVLAIRELFSSGLYTRKQIASMVNLEYTHVCQLIKGTDSWKHVK